MNVFLPATIQAFRKRYPEARLVLRELETADQLKALRDGAIDLGLPRLFGQDTEGLRIGPLFRERYALALPAAHPLTALKEIPLERVKGEPMVMMPRELQPALRDCLVERCVSVGFAPNIVQEAVSKQTTLALVEVGVGLAFVPMSSERQRPAGVVLRPLVGPLPDIEISAVSRAEATAAIIDNFIVLAKATIARRFRERNVAPINP